LRNVIELERLGVGPLSEFRVQYYNVPLITGTEDRNNEHFSNMGEVYLFCIRDKEYGKRLVETLEIIAEPSNLPLVFHCSVGKDRTGILAAIVLSVLGVAEADIIEDYTLSAPYMNDLITRLMNEPGTPDDIKNLPAYAWEAAPESMALFLSTIKREYGSARGYVEAQGAELSLIHRLERALLT
jgi:protein-tyrosine phosphatase